MQCGCSGPGDGEVHLWGLLMEAWGGASVGCCCHPSNWFWYYCTLLLLHLQQGCELLVRKSPLSHLETSFLLHFAKGDLAQDEEWAHEHLLPLDRDWAVPIAPQNHALIRCWCSSPCNSAMNWSCCLQGWMLSINSYCPWYTCSPTPRIFWSEDPRRVLTEGCSGAISLTMVVCCEWGAFACVTLAPSFT